MRRQNYYGSLCTRMYEILHEKASEEELNFYLSYAEKGCRILEPLCGSGRFLIPFMEWGFDITGLDLSGEMLAQLKQKAPDAKVIQADLSEYCPKEKYDYIFIPAGSISLFTDIGLCRKILKNLRECLSEKGKLVFSVETEVDRCPDSNGYEVSASVKTKEGFDLILKTKSFYDKMAQIQFLPGIYELYCDSKLQQREEMDFQIYLYREGEMEQYLKAAGFTQIKVYTSFSGERKTDHPGEAFLFECSMNESCPEQK